MKKRKPPIFALSFVIIAIGFVIFVGLRQHPMPQSSMAPTPAQNDNAPKSNDPSAIKKNMRNAVTADKMPMGMNPGGDPMVTVDAGPIKPKPSESSTDSQWYQPESLKKKPSDNN